MHCQVGHQTGDWHLSPWHILRRLMRYASAVCLEDERQKHFYISPYPHLDKADFLDIIRPALLNAHMPQEWPTLSVSGKSQCKWSVHGPRKGTVGLHPEQLVEGWLKMVPALKQRSEFPWGSEHGGHKGSLRPPPSSSCNRFF